MKREGKSWRRENGGKAKEGGKRGREETGKEGGREGGESGRKERERMR